MAKRTTAENSRGKWSLKQPVCLCYLDMSMNRQWGVDNTQLIDLSPWCDEFLNTAAHIQHQTQHSQHSVYDGSRTVDSSDHGYGNEKYIFTGTAMRTKMWEWEYRKPFSHTSTYICNSICTLPIIWNVWCHIKIQLRLCQSIWRCVFMWTRPGFSLIRFEMTEN